MLQDTPVDEENLYSRAEDPWCPTTRERAAVWEKFAPQLSVGAAKDVVREWGGDPLTITHVITNTRLIIHIVTLVICQSFLELLEGNCGVGPYCSFPLLMIILLFYSV